MNDLPDPAPSVLKPSVPKPSLSEPSVPDSFDLLHENAPPINVPPPTTRTRSGRESRPPKDPNFLYNMHVSPLQSSDFRNIRPPDSAVRPSLLTRSAPVSALRVASDCMASRVRG